MNNEWWILFHAARNVAPVSDLDDFDPILFSFLGRSYSAVNPKPTVPMYGITSDNAKHELTTVFLPETPNFTSMKGSSVCISPDGQYLVVGYDGNSGVNAPDMLVFKRSANSYVKLPNNTIDFFALGITGGTTYEASAHTWSTDGQYLMVTAWWLSGANGYPWPIFLKRTGDTFTRIGSALAINNHRVVSVSPDMTHIWLQQGQVGPSFPRSLYKRTGDTVTSIALPSIANSIPIGAKYDPTGTYLPLSVGTSYAIAKRSGDTYANIATLSGWSNSSKTSVASGWGPNGTLFAIADTVGTSLTVSLWSRSGDTFTYLTTSLAHTVTSADRVNGVAFNQDGTRVYVQMLGSTKEFEVLGGGTSVQISSSQFPIVSTVSSSLGLDPYVNSIAIYPSVYT